MNTENNVHNPTTKYSLWAEIVKGWQWLVFVIKMLQRMGGIKAIASTLAFTINLLVKRTLAQWQDQQKK